MTSMFAAACDPADEGDYSPPRPSARRRELDDHYWDGTLHAAWDAAMERAGLADDDQCIDDCDACGDRCMGRIDREHDP